MATGGCLCGAVRYACSGMRRDGRRSAISIAAGTLDGHTGLRVAAHWYLSRAGDYYELPADGLPRHELSGQATGAQPSV
jgi:hypothetical protein